ncbi:hypothetical protein [Azospirillum soli]|uniref:hypothetical protein n=1 Tax=Azospirillum soli TaxID=1304799 RepID=UPI001AE57715|nr:hypothetical protein [Azospirillum soli]MBP2316344.1 hypothetical protein [Azospirillum soli]
MYNVPKGRPESGAMARHSMRPNPTHQMAMIALRNDATVRVGFGPERAGRDVPATNMFLIRIVPAAGMEARGLRRRYDGTHILHLTSLSPLSTFLLICHDMTIAE